MRSILFLLLIVTLSSCTKNDENDISIETEPVLDSGKEIVIGNLSEILTINSVTGNQTRIKRFPGVDPNSLTGGLIVRGTYLLDGRKFYAIYRHEWTERPRDLIIIDMETRQVSYEQINLTDTELPNGDYEGTMVQDDQYLYTVVNDINNAGNTKIIKIDKTDFSSEVYFENFGSGDFFIKLIAVKNNFIYYRCTTFNNGTSEGRFLKKINVQTSQEDILFEQEDSEISINNIILSDQNTDKFVCVSHKFDPSQAWTYFNSISILQNNVIQEIFTSHSQDNPFEQLSYAYSNPVQDSYLEEITKTYYTFGRQTNIPFDPNVDHEKQRVYFFNIESGEFDYVEFDASRASVSDYWHILGVIDI